MKKLYLIFSLLTTLSLHGQWMSIELSDDLLNVETEYREVPTDYLGFNYNVESTDWASGQILLPNRSGEIKRYALEPSQLIPEKLGAKFPNIKAYIGTASDGTKAYIDISHKGLHAVLLEGDEHIYIDPLSTDTDMYMVYTSEDYAEETSKSLHRHFTCEIEENKDLLEVEGTPLKSIQLRSSGEPVTYRNYVLAIATTGEYCSFHGGSLSDNMSALTTAINRVNSILNIDMAVNFTFHPNNDVLLFCDGSTDPYTNCNTGTMINENVGAIRSRINSGTYDMGHVLGFNGGGLAQLGSVCGDTKERGVSCWPSPIGDPFHVAVVSHEIGHQFGAPHIFNGQGGSCGSNRSGQTPFEPGSGTTIMSYAGLCNSDNIIGSSDPYYNNGSLQRMYSFFNGFGDGCAEKTETGNTSPEILSMPESGFFIPISTPFELGVEAVDVDGDDLTYCWEQQDAGPQSALGDMNSEGPLFRSFRPSTDPIRYFPNLNSVTRNRSFRSEVLPTVSRSFNFYVTVRDNNTAGGGVTWDDVTFEATADAGPFLVSNFNSLNIDTLAGSEVEITWEVANTDIAPVNCKSVDILYSTDRGFTYDGFLAQSTPNTGSAVVFFPNVVSNDFRIKIKATDNIFFDLNNQDISLLENTTPGFTADIAPRFAATCAPDPVVFNISSEAFNDFEGDITVDVNNSLPRGYDIALNNATINAGGSTELVITPPSDAEAGIVEIDVVLTSGATEITRTLSIEVNSTDVSDQKLDAPADGAIDLGLNDEFAWTPSESAAFYNFELSTDAQFNNIIFSAENVTATSLIPTITLEENSVYYWRIQPFIDPCGFRDYSETFSFRTAAVSCTSISSQDVPVAISSTTSGTYESLLDIGQEFSIEDLNISALQGVHGNTGNLRFSLESPSGTSVLLIRQSCNLRENFDIKLDDDVLADIICPLNRGQTARPFEPLSAFNGEQAQGQWKLVIEDRTNTNGGSLQAWGVEFCGALPTDNPIIIANTGDRVSPQQSITIANSELQATDTDGVADDLIFTIVSNVKNGQITLDGVVLNAGDQFTQTDINNGLLRYTHITSDLEEDFFSFSVENDDNGWTGGQRFVIDVDLPVSNEEISFIADQITVFPNPAEDILNITSKNLSFESSFALLFNMEGQLLSRQAIRDPQNIQIQTESLASGIYLIRVMTDQGPTTLKFLKS